MYTSLVVVIIASIVCRSDAVVQYVNGAVIFGRCANFSIQAGSSVAFNGAQSNVATGNVGNSPGSSITGNVVVGTGYALEVNSASAINCAADQGIAYLNLTGVTCGTKLANSDLSGVTLFPGVYCADSPGALTLKATNLYLDAQGASNAQFIFQMATTLITSMNTKIVLLNGALAKNIYWQVGSSATLGANSDFKGQIVAYASISVDIGVNVLGRLYAQAAVTFAGADTVTLPSH